MAFSRNNLVYPPTSKIEESDIYHGIKVEDPYRWLEKPDSEATEDWVKAQNELTTSYLNTITTKDNIQQSLTKLWNYEKYSSPFKRGGSYFYFKNEKIKASTSNIYRKSSLVFYLKQTVFLFRFCYKNKIKVKIILVIHLKGFYFFLKLSQ